MADGPSKDNILDRHVSRRGFFNAAKEGGKIAATAILANELRKIDINLFPDISTSQPVDVTVTPPTPTIQEITNVGPASSPIPEVPYQPSSRESNPEASADEQRKKEATIAFKKHFQFYQGLLDDNPGLKKIIEDPNYNFNDHQLTIEAHPDLYSTVYKFRLDPNSKTDNIPDIQFISHENRPNLDNMLSVEFVIDHLGRIIPQMKNAPQKISNPELKLIVGKMTQFAPEEWEDKSIYDLDLKQDILVGIQGNNDSSIPRSYVQAQQNGRVILALFTPKPQPKAPGIIPKPDDVIRV